MWSTLETTMPCVTTSATTAVLASFTTYCPIFLFCKFRNNYLGVHLSIYSCTKYDRLKVVPATVYLPKEQNASTQQNVCHFLAKMEPKLFGGLNEKSANIVICEIYSCNPYAKEWYKNINRSWTLKPLFERHFGKNTFRYMAYFVFFWRFL